MFKTKNLKKGNRPDFLDQSLNHQLSTSGGFSQNQITNFLLCRNHDTRKIPKNAHILTFKFIFFNTTCFTLPTKVSINKIFLENKLFKTSLIPGDHNKNEVKLLQTATIENSGTFFL